MSQTFMLVVYAVIAAVLLFQLYNVLGKKVGRQPEDQAKSARKPMTPIGMPRAQPEAKPQVQAIDPVLAAAIKGLKDRDPAFDPARFLEGARQAHETILRAFARGDREALRPLLTEKVMTSFDRVISQREARGETESVDLVMPARADIEVATAEGDTARASVRFLAELRKTLTPASGEPVTDEYRTAEIWTFERRLGNADPNWVLARVQDATA